MGVSVETLCVSNCDTLECLLFAFMFVVCALSVPFWVFTWAGSVGVFRYVFWGDLFGDFRLVRSVRGLDFRFCDCTFWRWLIGVTFCVRL